MEKFERKPVGNFFIKKSLQVRLIVQIVSAVVLTTFVSLGTMVLVYFINYKTVVIYLYDKSTGEIPREHIVFLLLPTLVISALVNVALAIGIGFYASRKYAIPIYKLEQWCSLLLPGKLTALLQFREKEELKELSLKCNDLSRFFREHFLEIKRQIAEIKRAHPQSEQATQLEKTLEGLDLHTEPIEVNTTYYKSALEKERGKKS